MTESEEKAQLENALKKRALGFDTEECVEEYAKSDDGEIVLTKRKVTTKNVPPDITALKMLLDAEYKAVSEMSDEELEQEKIRLIKLLKDNQ